ncbi:hypothetical protein [Priestia megaterium]|uniref:hypothetical protein n=1 Tax=Priestia megaterium TaxID=1404 RepID=UPI0028774E1F|nr:hypothetical protein [Priestia megaterium]MBX4162373.1 hypothetical protein [Priestia megaterium]
MEINSELKNTNKFAQFFFKTPKKYGESLLYLLSLSLIAGAETTLLLYSTTQKGMNVLNGSSISEMGPMNFIISTIAMGSLGLLFTFIVQILIVYLLYLVLKEKPVNIKGIFQAVVNAGMLIVLGSGVNALVALSVNAKETTFTSLALLVKEKNSFLHTFVAEFELFYIASLILFSFSLEKLTFIKRKNAVIITITVALISFVFHIMTVASGTYLK